jgi:hypothetical protein
LYDHSKFKTTNNFFESLILSWNSQTY